MTISKSGISLIKQFEGFRAKAYRCSAGVLTIGYGHTLDVNVNDTVTEERATQFLEMDLRHAQDTVEVLVTQNLSQAQYDALVSFVFNVGSGNFRKSTMLKKINQGDFAGASGEFMRWTKAKGKELPGLVKRRAAEKKLFDGAKA